MKKIIFGLIFALFVCASAACVCAADVNNDTVPSTEGWENIPIPDIDDIDTEIQVEPEDDYTTLPIPRNDTPTTEYWKNIPLPKIDKNDTITIEPEDYALLIKHYAQNKIPI